MIVHSCVRRTVHISGGISFTVSAHSRQIWMALTVLTTSEASSSPVQRVCPPQVGSAETAALLEGVADRLYQTLGRAMDDSASREVVRATLEDGAWVWCDFAQRPDTDIDMIPNRSFLGQHLLRDVVGAALQGGGWVPFASHDNGSHRQECLQSSHARCVGQRDRHTSRW